GPLTSRQDVTSTKSIRDQHPWHRAIDTTAVGLEHPPRWSSVRRRGSGRRSTICFEADDERYKPFGRHVSVRKVSDFCAVAQNNHSVCELDHVWECVSDEHNGNAFVR